MLGAFTCKRTFVGNTCKLTLRALVIEVHIGSAISISVGWGDITVSAHGSVLHVSVQSERVSVSRERYSQRSTLGIAYA